MLKIIIFLSLIIIFSFTKLTLDTLEAVETLKRKMLR